MLIVASTRKWLADDFADAVDMRVVHDYGLDAPLLKTYDDVIWWTPMEHAVRLRWAGIPFNPDTPLDTFLSWLPSEVTGRHITTCMLRRVAPINGPVFCKIANSKHVALPAQWYDNIYEFVDLASQFIPHNTVVQYTTERLDIVEEWRCFVKQGRVVAYSKYKHNDNIYGDTDFNDDDTNAELVCSAVATWLQSQFNNCVVVIDVAVLRDGRAVMLEANPVWCSNPYGCDLTSVVDTIIEAFDNPVYEWHPNAALVEYAERKPLLQLSKPVWYT